MIALRPKFIGGMVLLVALLACATARSQPSASAAPVAPSRLCVTEGTVKPDPSGRLTVDSTKMRAYVNGWTSQSIAAHFTYVGPTAQASALGSGEIRRQFGLKLRAANACNLVYAMWRIEPTPEIVVSVKSNPGQTTSSQCGNRGYRNVNARTTHPAPGLRPGDSHTLSAEMHGDELRVFVDRSEVWQGNVGMGYSGDNDAVGIRSDNVRLALDLSAGAYVGKHPNYEMACKTGPDASD